MRPGDLLRRSRVRFLSSILLFCLFFVACSSKSKPIGHSPTETGKQSAGKVDPNSTHSGEKRETVTNILMTETPGLTVWTGSDGKIQVDASNTKKGYVCVKYTGTADRVQVQMTNPDGSRNPYPLQIGSFEGIPLTGGDGNYSIQVLEHVSGKTYAIGLSQTFDVQLENEFTPYLYPNQYCDYQSDDQAVKKGQELSDRSSDDLDFIRNVYHFVIKTIKYDDALAENIPLNYLPDPDTTLQKKKGICLDYASLTVAMLRSQGVPTKLEVGYSGSVYHAWISVWTRETGWIDKAIRFDGKDWTLVDPTLGANNSASSVKKYIGDGKNYTLSYNY